jgi:hypothetical protein
MVYAFYGVIFTILAYPYQKKVLKKFDGRWESVKWLRAGRLHFIPNRDTQVHFCQPPGALQASSCREIIALCMDTTKESRTVMGQWLQEGVCALQSSLEMQNAEKQL